ncbi:MAG TPA: DUF3857 domain-containing protein [Mucilaginibacter sp.]|jgi:hypothetical protein
MKKKLFILVILIALIKFSIAQDFSYNKITQQEIDLKNYQKDTSANAVILNEFGKAEITLSYNNAIRLVYEYHVKIKIFNHKGFSNGTVEIHLKNNEDNSVSDEINNIAGITSYKDDNGITQVTELDSKKIYTTRDYKFQTTMKFAMPGLHDGCVIEYRYILISPFLDHFHSWQFQSEIPKMNTTYEAHIPGFWRYNVALRGPLKLTQNQSDIEPNCFSAGGGSSGCLHSVYEMKDVPAFVKEEYMTSPKNFLSALNFDLLEYTNPYSGVKTNVTTDWKDIDFRLKKNPDFGAQLEKKDLVRENIPPAILDIHDDTERAKAIYKWVQTWFKWNNYTGIYSVDGIKKAIKQHSGGVADINITLVDALNAAGINAEAVLLSTRDHGVINKLYPVMGDFDYLLANVTIGENSFFLDATDPLLPFGILPVKCLNDQGRVFSFDKPSFWVNMDTKQSRINTYVLDLTLSEDGRLKGKLIHYSKSYDAYLKRKSIKKFNTLDEYVDNMEEHFNKIKILKSNIENIDSLDKPIGEEYELEINVKNNLDSGRFILNPYIFDKITNNPLKLRERNYPVDIGMPSENRYIITIHMPPHYTIENKLPDQSLQLPDNGGIFTTRFENTDNTFTFSNIVRFNKAIYQTSEYQYLKEFFNKIILAEKAEIVLRKKS